MRNCFLLFLLIPLLVLPAPLVEIAHPKASYYLNYLNRYFPKEKLNLVVYPKYRSPYISVNGSSLPSFKEDVKLREVLKRRIEEALREEKNLQISLDSVSITRRNEELLFSFAPCNYSKSDFSGRWVAFVTDGRGYLLRRSEGELQIPAGACGRPIGFSWKKKYQPERLVFIVAIYDGKGKYIVSKSNKEVKGK